MSRLDLFFTRMTTLGLLYLFVLLFRRTFCFIGVTFEKYRIVDNIRWFPAGYFWYFDLKIDLLLIFLIYKRVNKFSNWPFGFFLSIAFILFSIHISLKSPSFFDILSLREKAESILRKKWFGFNLELEQLRWSYFSILIRKIKLNISKHPIIYLNRIFSFGLRTIQHL